MSGAPKCDYGRTRAMGTLPVVCHNPRAANSIFCEPHRTEALARVARVNHDGRKLVWPAYSLTTARKHLRHS